MLTKGHTHCRGGFLLISSDFFEVSFFALLCISWAMEQGSMMAHHGLKNLDLPFTKTIQAVPTDGCPHHPAPEVTRKCRYILYLRGDHPGVSRAG